MIKRPFWLAVGAALGVGGTLWAEQRVRREVRRAVDVVTPLGTGAGWAAAAKEAQGRVAAAARSAATERRQHEQELWERLDERHSLRREVAPAPRSGQHAGGASHRVQGERRRRARR
jgi:hypothetical protein